ncbi:MAG: hypothetical protein ACREQX_04400 [Candidatus Binataceae bacterium]
MSACLPNACVWMPPLRFTSGGADSLQVFFNFFAVLGCESATIEDRAEAAHRAPPLHPVMAGARLAQLFEVLMHLLLLSAGQLRARDCLLQIGTELGDQRIVRGCGTCYGLNLDAARGLKFLNVTRRLAYSLRLRLR